MFVIDIYEKNKKQTCIIYFPITSRYVMITYDNIYPVYPSFLTKKNNGSDVGKTRRRRREVSMRWPPWPSNFCRKAVTSRGATVLRGAPQRRELNKGMWMYVVLIYLYINYTYIYIYMYALDR